MYKHQTAIPAAMDTLDKVLANGGRDYICNISS